MGKSLRNCKSRCNQKCFQKDVCQPLCVNFSKTVAHSPVHLGCDATFILTVDNLTCKIIKNVTIADFLPVGFTFVDATPAGSFIVTGTPATGQVVTFNLNKLGLGSTCFTVTATPPAVGTFTDIATLTFNNCPNLQPVIATADVTVVSP